MIREGIIQGQTIVLENSTGLPDGQETLVGIGVPCDQGTNPESTQDELIQELEAEKARQTIYRMRHSSRSVREL